MKVEHNGRYYLISFKHETLGKEKRKGYRETICQISEVKPDGKKVFLCGSTATCGPSDQFVKEVGRKKSLTRALLDADDKGFREAFWKAYFNRKGS